MKQDFISHDEHHVTNPAAKMLAVLSCNEVQ